MSHTTELNDPLVGTVVAGRYHVVRRLAAGGMGVVYEARQEPLGRRVALKVIRGDANDPVARQRFEREAKAASALQDAHVVVVHDFGVMDGGGGLFLAMEFLEGETLRQRLAASGRVPWEKTRSVVKQIAQALAQAHSRGLVHRDLKPENVMLVVTERHDIVCKVLDFGLAKSTGHDTLLRPGDQPLTRSGGFVGTPGYISPEVIDGAADDPRQDVYALGVVWWELLTGRHPFPAETPMKTLLRQMQEEAPPLDDVLCLSDGIPALGASLVRDMMARDPQRRPKDGNAVLARLDTLFGDTRSDERIVVAVDHAAPTIAAPRSSVGSGAPQPSGDPVPLMQHSSVGMQEGALTVDGRRRPSPSAPSSAPSPSAPPAPPALGTETPPSLVTSSASPSSSSSSSSLAPAPVEAVVAPSGSGVRRRRLRPRQRLFAALVGASVLGTIGGVVALRTIEQGTPEQPAPPPPEPPSLPVAPVVTHTDVVVEGVPTFAALRGLRDALPPHTLLLYRGGYAELRVAGDVGSDVADRLLGTSFLVDEVRYRVEVKEIVAGKVVAVVALSDGTEVDVDGGVVGVDGGVAPALDDAGVAAAPGGLEP